MSTIIYYTYYIATSSSGLDSATGVTTKDTSYTWSDVDQGATYYVRVEVSDTLGNTTYVDNIITTGTLDVEDGAISISDPAWSDGVASVTITNKTDYIIQYQIIKEGGEFDASNTWTEVSNTSSLVVPDLYNNYTVYARLADENGNVGTTISKKISDTTAPTVIVSGNPTTWTAEDVTLTVTAEDTESGLAVEAYSFDGGTTWTTANTNTYEENTSGIIIKVRDVAGNIATYTTINITYIDKTGPELTLSKSDVTTRSALITVASISDSGVGLPSTVTYTYYTKADGEDDYTEYGSTTDSSMTVDKLTAGIDYVIKVTAEDALGNVGEKTIELTTTSLLYSEGDVTWTNAIWHNGYATITVTNNRYSSYSMTYQISEDGASVSENGTWTLVSDPECDLEGLADGTVVYVKITDEYNKTSGYATILIDNPAEDSYTDDEIESNTTRADIEILGISVSASELQVQVSESLGDDYIYAYYYKTVNDTEYTRISTNTYYYEPAVITDIESGGTYKIKVVAVNGTNRNKRYSL